MKQTKTQSNGRRAKDGRRPVRSSACVGADLIRAERRRQIDGEGWAAEHDDTHKTGELARAAACYAFGRVFRYFNGWISGHGHGDEPRLTSAWPWSEEWWKPSPHDRIRELVKAGALIAAEIDRLHRERTKAPTDKLTDSRDANQKP